MSYVESNLIGTFHILEMARKYKLDHLLMASTSSVYGSNKDMPLHETQKCDTPMSFYAATKKSNETMAHSYSHLYDIPTTIFRFFTVYGPWGRPDMALFDFTKNIIAGNPIQLFNNGDMVRDFTYIDDIINGINILLQTAQNTPDKLEDIYCIGRGEKVMLMDFVDEIENNLSRKAIRKLVPMHPADAQTTWSDTTKLQKLGYHPKVSIAEGVEKFVSWYKGYYKVN